MYNKKLIEAFKKLNIYRKLYDNNIWKINTNKRIIDILELLDYDIKSSDELKEIKGIGKKSLEKIDSILKSKTKIGIPELDELNNNIIKKINIIFNSENNINLNISRNIIDNFSEFFYKLIQKNKINIEYKIAGSYRRNQATSNDIDILLYSTTDTLLEFEKIMSLLNSNLTKIVWGNIKFEGILKFEGYNIRIDFLFLETMEEYPYALLYFTGNKQFNIEMRKIAKKKGYKLSNLFMVNELDEKLIVKKEKDIFDLLGMKYIKPEDRK